MPPEAAASSGLGEAGGAGGAGGAALGVSGGFDVSAGGGAGLASRSGRASAPSGRVDWLPEEPALGRVEPVLPREPAAAGALGASPVGLPAPSTEAAALPSGAAGDAG